jgi:hypothetical protein
VTNSSAEQRRDEWVKCHRGTPPGSYLAQIIIIVRSDNCEDAEASSSKGSGVTSRPHLSWRASKFLPKATREVGEVRKSEPVGDVSNRAR